MIGYSVYNTQKLIVQRNDFSILEREIDSRTSALTVSEKSLRASEERYKGLVDSQNEFIVRVDLNGKINFANDAFRAKFINNIPGIRDRSVIPLLFDSSENIFNNFVSELLKHPFRTQFEKKINFENDSTWISWENNSIKDESGKIFELQIVGRDITSQILAKEMLEKIAQERTAELSSLIEQSPFGIMIFDNNGNLLLINSAFSSMFSIDFSHVQSIGYNIFLDDQFTHSNYFDNLQKIFDEGGFLITDPLFVENNIRGIFSNAKERWFIFRIYSVGDLSGNIERVVALVEDVTQQKYNELLKDNLVEQKVRSSVVLETTENERLRISRDLHDGLGQLLTSITMKLEVFKHRTKSSDKMLLDVLESLGSAGTEVNQIVHELHPVEIDNYGLFVAVERLVEASAENSNIEIEYSAPEIELDIEKRKLLAIFRIIQEGLNNAVKHSSCRNLTINIYKKQNELIVEIIDDGIGFNLNRKGLVDNSNGLGLINLYQRSELIGGKFSIKSSLGKGTSLRLTLPLL